MRACWIFPESGSKSKSGDSGDLSSHSRGDSETDEGPSGYNASHWRTIYEYAGIVGVDPFRLSLRELDIMARTRLRHFYNGMSHIVSIVHNVNCTKRSDMKTPSQMNPYRNI